MIKEILESAGEWLNNPPKPKSTREEFEKFYGETLKGNDFEAGYEVGFCDAMVAILNFIDVNESYSSMVERQFSKL